MKKLLPILCAAAGLLVSISAFSQVSNDNEDGVNKVNEQQRQNFVPGQAIVKFKDESGIQVHNNAQGRFRAASINAVDEILRDFGVDEMEKLFPSATPKSQSQLRRKAAPNGVVVQESNLDKVFWVKTGVMSSDSTMQLVKRLQELPEVEYAEPNYYAYITADMPTDMPVMNTPTDQKLRKAPVSVETTAEKICPNPSNNPLYTTYQYGIRQLNIDQLWNQPIVNKKRPVIAILDTGVDINHPDLADNIWTNPKEVDGETAYDDDSNGLVDDVHGWNFVEDYYDVTDHNGHGTHCAGIAAAADNAVGIVGANPLALIMPVKVLSDKGLGDQATIARGIVYAVENGADILSMSFGSEGLSQTERDALDYAYQTAILVGAAGNNGSCIYSPKGRQFPGAYYIVLGVEACDQNGSWVEWSNYDPDGPIYSEQLWGLPEEGNGENYEVKIPGVDILSTYPNGQYKALNGTSMSTPLFAGAVSALLMVKDYPSRDVLYGDLIHLKADFAKIYSNETPRMPKIDLLALNVDDNVEGNNNIDGQVDVGETVLFTSVLRNTWADASEVQLKLTVDPLYASFVNIENPVVDFGNSLSAYGRAASETPIRVQFANNIGDATRIKFTLEVSCLESQESFAQDVYVTVNNMVKLGGFITENRTLTADHLYHVTQNIAIPEGVTLTIEPGTRLEFDEDTELSSFGTLIAKGTPEKPIVFTGHRGAVWKGIMSHTSNHNHYYDYFYTNEENTLFTLSKTDLTPIPCSSFSFYLYYDPSEDSNPGKTYEIEDYIDLLGIPLDYKNGSTIANEMNMNVFRGNFTDPNVLAPMMSKLSNDILTYYNSLPDKNKHDSEGYSSCWLGSFSFRWITSDNPRDTISYCRIDCYDVDDGDLYNGRILPYMRDCILEPVSGNLFNRFTGERNTITNWRTVGNSLYYINSGLKCCNIVNNDLGNNRSHTCKYSLLNQHNFINNYLVYQSSEYEAYNGKRYSLAIHSSKPEIDKAQHPSYLGTSREDIVRPYMYEFGNAPDTYGIIDLSNMPNRPYSEAHGIVWKVCVNGKDAQDEYEDLAPLGVGKHKFEVYFNRPMNKAVAPQITFGAREPYTQFEVAEDGNWNADGTIYTAYVSITGKTMSDGKNRIYVQGAEDNEFFPCPYEKTRFNFMISAAGSMATCFAADAKMGRVDLTWNNDENDFDDAMGFNVYRYHEYEKLLPVLDEWGGEIWDYDAEKGEYIQQKALQTVADTLCLNTEILDIETTSFIDYDVTPGETYYYYYKVLSTDLQEYDVSNVVAATPLTSTLGDANGSGDVDVADVITTVNYAAGMEPKPFIFEAADMNTDKNIDILDVVGIIQKILNPSAGAKARIESVATYTVEDGIVYVESPVELAGVQLQLNAPEQEAPEALKALNGFEHASAWLTDEDYLFLGYNMNGKTIPAGRHALLNIGNAQLRSIRLSDTMGGNVMAEAGNATAIEMQTAKVLINTRGIYNLNGQKVAGKAEDLEKLPKGVYVVDGIKVVK